LLLPASGTASAGWDPWKGEVAPPGDGYSAKWLDGRVAEETNPARLAGLAAIRFYQLFIGPGLGSNCQFHPSCSRYTFAAIYGKGFLNGTLMGAERLMRCNGSAHLQGYPEWENTGLMEDSPGEKEAPIPWISRFGL
jgi:putative membrane protein insertion efficiency factor